MTALIVAGVGMVWFAAAVLVSLVAGRVLAGRDRQRPR